MSDGDPHALSSTFCCLPYKDPFLNGSSFKSLPEGQMHHDDFYVTSEAPVTTVMPHSVHTPALSGIWQSHQSPQPKEAAWRAQAEVLPLSYRAKGTGRLY